MVTSCSWQCHSTANTCSCCTCLLTSHSSHTTFFWPWSAQCSSDLCSWRACTVVMMEVDTLWMSKCSDTKSHTYLCDDLNVVVKRPGSIENQPFRSVSLELTSGVGVLHFIRFRFTNNVSWQWWCWSWSHQWLMQMNPSI